MNPFKKTSKQTSTTNQTSTMQRTNPEWSESLVKDFAGEIGDLGDLDPSIFVRGPTALQNQAAGGAAGLGPMEDVWRGALDTTAGVMHGRAPQADAVKASKYLSEYQNPFTDEVINATLADFDFDAGQTRAQQDLNLAGSGAFGGSGAAIERSMTNDALSRGRAKIGADLRLQGFNTALGAAMGDADRRAQTNALNAQLAAGQMDRALGAAGQLTDIDRARGAEERANAGLQFDMGEALRRIETEQARAPLDLMKLRSDLLANLPLDLFSGATTTTTGTSTAKGSMSDPMGDAAKLAQVAAMFMSDRRLKRDIVKLYDRPDGLGVYLYRYLWSPLRFIGVMAQEVLAVKPEAVARHPSGFLMVDYGRL